MLFKETHRSIPMVALCTALALHSSKHVRLNSVYASTCATFSTVWRVCGFDLIVVSLLFGSVGLFWFPRYVCVWLCSRPCGADVCIV